MSSVPRDFFKTLPVELPPGEPYYYLSAAQKDICSRRSQLARYAPHLPGWVPHRQVADALGHDHTGIENALKRLDECPYVWCTEFENVHSFWNFREPRFRVGKCSYHGSEDFFHKQKPSPFDKEIWDGPGPGRGRRDQVMRQAVQMKFQDEELKALLISTGENMLARLLMEHRAELLADAGDSANASATNEERTPDE